MRFGFGLHTNFCPTGYRLPICSRTGKKLGLLVISAFLLSACELPSPNPPRREKKKAQTFRGRSVSPLVADSDFKGRVVGVVDGDTLDVLVEKRSVRVRLSGIDCPEKSQPFGMRAKQAAAALCFGSSVTVHPKDKDRYGRLVAEVILADGRNLNREMVRQGYAWWYRQYSTDAALEKLEREARSARRGLWVQADPQEPSQFRSSRSRGGVSRRGNQKPGPG